MSLKSSPTDGNGGSIPVASDRYVKELDGIRAIAIGIVVCAHYQLVPFKIPGGFGVTLFFFLSGYLITTLFYSEYKSNNNIDIFKFYLRRWLRLTPPLVISVLIGVIFYRITRVAVDSRPVPIGTTMAALLYYTNYYDLAWAMEPSRVIPFGVCWSLAVEEHFYLLWPLVIRKNINNTSRLLVIIVGACITIVLWRVVAHYILLVSTDYTGMATDTRMNSILYGALLRVLFETPWASTVVNICKTRLPSNQYRHTYDYFRCPGRWLSRDNSVLTSGYRVNAALFGGLIGQPTTVARRVLASPIMVLLAG